MDQGMKKIAVWVVLGGMILFSAGCAGVGVKPLGKETGNWMYWSGELWHAYSVPMEKAWKASEEVVAEKNMKVTEKFIENMDRNRVIKGKTLDGKDFKISLEAKAADVTVIRVRIGAIGDNPRSQKIHDWIVQKF